MTYRLLPSTPRSLTPFNSPCPIDGPYSIDGRYYIDSTYSSLDANMTFYKPAWAPALADADIPDDLSVSHFLFDDRLRPRKCKDSPKPFIESVDGSGYDIAETQQRIEWLAAGIASRLGINDISGDVWKRVVGLFSVNNVSKSLGGSPMSIVLTFSRSTIPFLLGLHTDSMVLSRQPTSPSGYLSLPTSSGTLVPVACSRVLPAWIRLSRQ